jgi:hypothetical protein
MSEVIYQQIQEPMGPQMKQTQKNVLTAACILAAVLFLGAMRYLPVLYHDWLIWAEIVGLGLLLILLLSILPDLYRKPQKK